MIYRANIRPAWVVLFLLLLFAVAFALVKSTDLSSSRKKVKPVEKIKIVDLEQFPVNEKCLRCHGQSKYTFENAESSVVRKSEFFHSEKFFPKLETPSLVRVSITTAPESSNIFFKTNATDKFRFPSIR